MHADEIQRRREQANQKLADLADFKVVSGDPAALEGELLEELDELEYEAGLNY